MTRTLTEDIARGYRAVHLARQLGKDTRAWEEHLATLERQALLAWACDLAELDMVLPDCITFIEAPQRPVTTGRVSWYAREYLRTISFARLQQQSGGVGQWTTEWWKKRQGEAVGALEALRQALCQRRIAK